MRLSGCGQAHATCGAISCHPSDMASRGALNRNILRVITKAATAWTCARALPKLRVLLTASRLGTGAERRRCRTRPWHAGGASSEPPECTTYRYTLTHGHRSCRRLPRAHEHLGSGRALGTTRQRIRPGSRQSLDVRDGEVSRRQLICLSGRLRGTRGKQRAEQVSSSGGREIRSHLPQMNSLVTRDEQRLSQGPVHNQQQH